MRQLSDDALEPAARPPQSSRSRRCPHRKKHHIRSPARSCVPRLSMPTSSSASLTRHRLTANGKGYPPSQTSGSARPVGHRGTFLILGPVFGVYTRVISWGITRNFFGQPFCSRVRWCGPSKRPQEGQDEFISSVLMRFELVQRGWAWKTLLVLVRHRYQDEGDGEADRTTNPDHK